MGGETSVAGKYTIEELKHIISPIAQQYGVDRISLF